MNSIKNAKKVFGGIVMTLFITISTQASIDNISDAINKAGQQRMITQRMLKNYALIGMNNIYGNPKEDLPKMILLFDTNINELKIFIKDKASLKSLGEVSTLWTPIKKVLQEAPSKEKVVKLQEDLEKLLEIAHKTTELIVKSSGQVSSQIVNTAGTQRMLSQRIAKNYFYKGLGINATKSGKQLQISMAQFSTALKKLDIQAQNKKVKKMVKFVNMSNLDFMSIASEKYNLENATIILDLSESMLEGSQYIVKILKNKNKKQSTAIVDLSGKQRMLSQRIAKYYIAYQAGIKDDNSIVQMNASVKAFTEAHTTLMNNKTNSAEINKRLQKVDKLWKIVFDFYKDIEEGGLPVIVYNTTDNIMKEMNKITKMYVKLQ